MPKRILIVDDSPIILAASQHALVTAGFDVETRVGIDELGDKGCDGFDLILMDIQMPELYGDDVAAVLKHERDVRTPIYLFSTLPEEELATRAGAARVDGYICKAEGVEHLVDRVREILG
jgi:DNA-binding response OmpR family regulator